MVMSLTFKIYQNYYVDLVKCLPMNDVIFIGELFKCGLLPHDLKAKLRSLPTSTDKAAKFLDDVIEPGIQAKCVSGEVLGKINTQFALLLSIMKNCGNLTVEKLAETIMAELDHKSIFNSNTLGE